MTRRELLRLPMVVGGVLILPKEAPAIPRGPALIPPVGMEIGVRRLTVPTKQGWQPVTLALHGPRLVAAYDRAPHILPVGQTDYQNYGNGGEWTDYAMMLGVSGLLDFICGVFAAGAHLSGYMNIWIDAVNALCLAQGLVTGALSIGQQIYTAYERQISQRNATYWANLIGSCPMGPIC